MRDPDLVVRAQQAATALESAWCRWRNMHGLAADPAPAVSSYVGFSLDAPWGQPRIVFGICAEEAEQLADSAGPARLCRPGARVGQGQAGRRDARQPGRGQSGPGCPEQDVRGQDVRGPGCPGCRMSGVRMVSVRTAATRMSTVRTAVMPGRPRSGAGRAGGAGRAARDPAGVRARPGAGPGQRGPAAVSGLGLVPAGPHAARATRPAAKRSRRGRADQPGRAPAVRDRDAHRAGRLAGGRGLDGQPPGGRQRPVRRRGSGRVRGCRRGRGIIGPGQARRPGLAVRSRRRRPRRPPRRPPLRPGPPAPPSGRCRSGRGPRPVTTRRS